MGRYNRLSRECGKHLRAKKSIIGANTSLSTQDLGYLIAFVNYIALLVNLS